MIDLKSAVLKHVPKTSEHGIIGCRCGWSHNIDQYRKLPEKELHEALYLLFMIHLEKVGEIRTKKLSYEKTRTTKKGKD